MENFRSIATLAAQRGDKPVSVMASLLEGLAHLKAKREESVARVQACLAQASKYQLDESVHIPQLDFLTHLLDLACSLQLKSPKDAVTKMTALQNCADEWKDSPLWGDASSDLLLPLRKQSTSSPTISSDTAAVIRPGDGERDFLVLKSFSKVEAYTLA